MNNKITFPNLASMLADRSGRSKRFSEDFLREFFTLISETLEKGESVKVKGLGTFRLSKVEARKSVDVTTGLPMEIAGHSKVVFVPAKEMADAVNSPFEAFSAIEINEGFDVDSLDSIGSFENTDIRDEADGEEYQMTETPVEPTEENDTEGDVESLEVEECILEVAPDLNEEAADGPVETSSELEAIDIAEIELHPHMDESVILQSATIDSEVIDSPNIDTEVIDSASTEYGEMEYDHESDSRQKGKWLGGFIAGMLVAVAIMAVAGVGWWVFAKPEKSLVDEKIAEQTESAGDQIDMGMDAAAVSQSGADDIADVPDEEDLAPTAPSDEVVYDTIGKTRYLTTMAKDHYGNYNLWPYIYEENKSFLRHPDRIKPGTQVVVPKLSKYGVNPENSEDIAKAKRLGVEIYGRYKTTP